MKLTEKLYDKMLASCRGGFLGLTWGVCDANGEALDREQLTRTEFRPARNPLSQTS